MTRNYRQEHMENTNLILASATTLAASVLVATTAPIAASLTGTVAAGSGLYFMGRTLYLYKSQWDSHRTRK